MINIIVGNCLETLKELPDQSVNCCVTSPPYFGLRDYGHADQIGNESTPDEFVGRLVDVFAEVRRVLRDDGTLWLNLGDSYAGSGGAGNQFGQLEKGLAKYKQKGIPQGLKSKDLIGIPWRVAFALQADDWYLRQDIIWHKPNPMPEPVEDRCTKAHEYLFLLAKSERYFFDSEAIQEKTTATEGTKNKRSVWPVNVQGFPGAHFATFPPDLIMPCILAGCPENGTVLDPFGGAGTTGIVAHWHNRNAILCELNPAYAQLAKDRIMENDPMFAHVEVS